KRQLREREAAARQSPDALAEITLRELLSVVDEELHRLPSQYRTPLVLCYLQGRTRYEAAQQLGSSLATLGRRLERGRELLRRRLACRGLRFSVALFSIMLSQSAASAAVRPALTVSTVNAAVAVATGLGVAIPAKVALLAEGVLKTMFLDKLRL